MFPAPSPRPGQRRGGSAGVPAAVQAAEVVAVPWRCPARLTCVPAPPGRGSPPAELPPRAGPREDPLIPPSPFIVTPMFICPKHGLAVSIFRFPCLLFFPLNSSSSLSRGAGTARGGRGTWARTVQLHRRGATFTWGRSVLGRVPARHRRETWRGAEAGGTSCGRLVFAQKNVQIITDAWKPGGITQALGAGWDRHRDAWEQDGRCPWQQLAAVLSRGPPSWAFSLVPDAGKRSEGQGGAQDAREEGAVFLSSWQGRRAAVQGHRHGQGKSQQTLKFKPGFPGTGKDKAGRSKEREGMGQKHQVGQSSPFAKPVEGLAAPQPGAGRGGRAGTCLGSGSRGSGCKAAGLQMDPGWCLFDKGLLAACCPALPGNQPVSKFLNTPNSYHSANGPNIPTWTFDLRPPGAA